MSAEEKKEAAEEKIADGFVNAEGLMLAKKEVDKAEPDKAKTVLPKLFVKTDVLEEVQVEVVYNPFDGEVLSITQPDVLNIGALSGLGVVRYKFKFSPVSYDQMMFYKRASSRFDQQAKEMMVDRSQLRSFLMINHLRETDMNDEDGQPFKIELDDRGNMSTKTLQRLYKTIPVLLESVMEIFEKRLHS
jgi:hypothetical protein